MRVRTGRKPRNDAHLPNDDVTARAMTRARRKSGLGDARERAITIVAGRRAQGRTWDGSTGGNYNGSTHACRAERARLKTAFGGTAKSTALGPLSQRAARAGSAGRERLGLHREVAMYDAMRVMSLELIVWARN